MELRERMLQAVLDAGFDRAGCLPLRDAADPRIQEWLASGLHGEMDYLERHAPTREDPAGAFPIYRSVIVAAFEYGEVRPAPRDPLIANISRYALGDDYHALLKARLLSALTAIRATAPGVRARAFVDAGPLNEKLIAARAGLGFVGKHTNLIDVQRGSYLLLGLLLVNVELEATGPAEPDRCGTCAACIPACPTGAIIAPYVLDARRCISYLTIEIEGGIPRELRPLIGNRIFGCDDCQEACPWNRFARSDPPPPFAPRAAVADLPLASWLRLDADGFKAAFEGSPVGRPGHRGFLRNVLVAAGCSGSVTLIPGVAPHLKADDPMIREHAAWALGRIGGTVAIRLLQGQAATETDPAVRQEVARSLEETERCPRAQ